jgi:hypothetical protein
VGATAPHTEMSSSIILTYILTIHYIERKDNNVIVRKEVCV